MAFRRRLRNEGDSVPEFSQVVSRIQGFLAPAFEAICQEREFFGTWDNGTGQWVAGDRIRDGLLQSEGNT